MAHKTCKGTFFKDTFLLSQKIIEKEDAGRVEDDNEPSNSDESNETLLLVENASFAMKIVTVRDV